MRMIIEKDFAILPGTKAIVSTSNKSADGAKDIIPLPVPSLNALWENWGDDNLFPQNVLEIGRAHV